MYWSELLEHAQGVMIFENMENSRVSPPMTDASGSQQFRRGQKSQMDFIWGTMFPRSKAYIEELEAKREEYKSKRAMYKGMQDNINKSRGTYSEPQNE